MEIIYTHVVGIAEPRRIAASFGPGGITAATTAPAASAAGTSGDLDRSKSYLDANAAAAAADGGGGSGGDTVIDFGGAGGDPPVALDTLVTMVDCESFLHHFTDGSEVCCAAPVLRRCCAGAVAVYCNFVLRP